MSGRRRLSEICKKYGDLMGVPFLVVGLLSSFVLCGTNLAFANGNPIGQDTVAVTVPIPETAQILGQKPEIQPFQPAQGEPHTGFFGQPKDGNVSPGSGQEPRIIERALIKEAVTEKEEEKQIGLNFRGVAIKDAINVLCLQAGVNIIIDKDIDQLAAVTAIYSGISIEDALRSILTGYDLTFTKISGAYLVTPWEEKYMDVNKLFMSSVSSGGGTGNPSNSSSVSSGGGTGNPSNSSSVSSGGGTGNPSNSSSVSSGGVNAGNVGGSSGGDFGGYIENMVTNLSKIMSPKGVITYMPTGFIYVKDYPSRVAAIEKTLGIDNAKRDSINVKVTLLRIDYKDKHETGIDWSRIIGGTSGTSGLKVELGTNFTGNLSSGSVASLKISNPADTLSATIKALSQYGDVSIAHSWETRTMSGTTIPFELTQTVWYTIGSTIQVVNNQTITTPQMSSQEVGLKITLNPLKYGIKYLVNTKIDISSLVGYQTVGSIQLPNLEKNLITIPIKMGMGETVAISGFKIKSTDKQSMGLPWLAKIPILSSLFGYSSSENKTSEFTVLISFAQGNVEGSDIK